MFMNTGNQTDENQDLIPCFGTINWDDFEDKWQFPQTTDLKIATNTSKDMEERNKSQNYSDVLSSSMPLPNQVSATHPETELPYAKLLDSPVTNGGGTLQTTAALNQVHIAYPSEEISSTQGFNSSIINENGAVQSTTLQNQAPNVHSPIAMSNEQCFDSPMTSNSSDFHSTVLTNQVSNVHAPSNAPYTQSFDSSINKDNWTQILAAVEDPNADISPFREYVNQCDGGQNTIPWTQQDSEDLLSFIVENQIGTSSVGNCQTDQQVEVGSSASSQFQLSGQKVMNDSEFLEQKNFNSSNMETISYNGKIPLVNYSVIVKENNSYINKSDNLNATDVLKGASAFNASFRQVTCQNTNVIKTSIPGPSRTRVGLLGRCRQGEVPLYLQPEPENAKDKIIWRRAIISHQHREKKKNELIINSNIIENLKQEMDELKNKLRVVTAERDTLKTTLDTMKHSPRVVQVNSNHW